MRKESLDLVEVEVVRLLKTIRVARLAANTRDLQWGCPETAAVRCASMDVTRALAQLRKP